MRVVRYYECIVDFNKGLKNRIELNLKNVLCVTNQLSSLSIEDPGDAEMAHTMRNLSPRAGHTFPSRETQVMDRNSDGRTRPHTPGTPTFMRQAGRNLKGSEPDLLHRCHFSFTSSLESQLSPSQSKSPWSRVDPYNSPKVMFEIFQERI